MNLRRHLPTIAWPTPRRAATAAFVSPLAQCMTMRARMAIACALLRRLARRSSASRSSVLSTRSAFGRPIYAISSPIVAGTTGETRRPPENSRSRNISSEFRAQDIRAEGLTRNDPVDLGRLLGLDRAPEVRTLRRRTEELAGTNRSAQLGDALPRHHLQAHEVAAGVLYVDGHVRAYHGGRELPKAHVARIRLAMPAELDTWVCDANGDGVLVWSPAPGASLVGELRQVTAKVRALLGDQASPTIAFDRGGWSPKLFKELSLALLGVRVSGSCDKFQAAVPRRAPVM